MVIFTLSIIRPLIVTKIGLNSLQTNIHRLLLLTCLLLFGTSRFSAQEVGQNNSIPIKSSDTLEVSINQFAELPQEQTSDTIKNDTLIKPPEFLSGIVDYHGEDYVLMNRKQNKMYLYNEAFIIYEDMRIDAGYIILDNNKKEVYARGIIDSSGNYIQRPVFVQGQNKVEPDSIRFNHETKKALIYNARTQQGEINTIAEVSKKENDSVYFMSNVKFTTAKDIDRPEYYFFSRKVKLIPREKIVTGLTNMYIADVPTPLGVPFAYFPLEDKNTSGFIIPTIGENSNRGFFFQNGGYYFAISDYLDLLAVGDYYTNGSYGLRFESNYAWRYHFRGQMAVRYENLVNSERGFPDYAQSSVYNIQWRHQQDPKSNPNSRFSASVNLGSSRYYRQSINQLNTGNFLNNTLSSSVSYSRTFEGDPQVNLSLTATHSQNTNTQEINMTLPNFTASVSRIYPFASKSGSKKGIIQNINLQYDVTAQNRITTTDSLFFKSEMFNNALLGAQHNIPIATNFKIFNYLNVNLATNYKESWVFQTYRKYYDTELNQVINDTIRGFDSYRTYNFSSGLSTTLYGMFNFGENQKIQAIRHVVNPSVGFSINPAFDQYYEDLKYNQVIAGGFTEEEILTYSRFEGSMFGAPNQRFSSSVSFAVNNTLEAKVRSKDSTATEAKKIKILNNLNLSTSYDIAADSLKWSPLRIAGSLPIIEKLDLNFSSTLNPYALDNNNRLVNEWNINNGGSLFRLTDANASLNYNFSSRDFQRDRQDDMQNRTYQSGGRKDDLFGDSNSMSDFSEMPQQTEEENVNVTRYRYSIPWDLRLAYTVSYNNGQRQNEISSHSLMFSGNVDISPRWTVGVNSGYDFKNKGFTYTQFRFQRDLESWQMSFNWVPFSSNASWYFFIGIKASVLSDIKYDKHREPDRRLF